LKGNDRTQGKGFSCVMAVLAAALLIVAAKTAYDYRNTPIKDALADVKAAQYFVEHPGPFCTFEGIWYDWERDETITLGCLEVSRDHREGHYSSTTGPRAASNFSMTGTYNIDSDSCIRVIGQDREGKTVQFTSLIEVEDVELPTQMIFVDEKGQAGFFIWKRKE
jgi:hypothetical protein